MLSSTRQGLDLPCILASFCFNAEASLGAVSARLMPYVTTLWWFNAARLLALKLKAKVRTCGTAIFAPCTALPLLHLDSASSCSRSYCARSALISSSRAASCPRNLCTRPRTPVVAFRSGGCALLHSRVRLEVQLARQGQRTVHTK